MDLLDRLLGHDAWTTRRLLELCRGLADNQLDRHFDVGHETVRRTLVHVVGNVEVWTDLMAGRPPRLDAGPNAGREPVAEIIARFDAAAADFAALARAVAAAGRLDELWTDLLDDPPRTKTYGGAILHVVTHGMHHRCELLHMLGRLGLPDLPEGDVLSWEGAIRPSLDGGAGAARG